MPARQAAPAAAAPPRFSIKRVHPTFSIEPCPKCQYPEADGGFCPECGWTAARPDCRHCVKEKR